MPGPWEKYATQQSPDKSGPWTKYGAAPPAAPTATPTPEATPAAPAQDEGEGFWHWFLGGNPGDWTGSTGKGLVATGLRKMGEYGKQEARKRENYRSSKEYYDKVQKQYNDAIARVNASNEPERSKAWHRAEIARERDNNLSASAGFLEQLAPQALQPASRIASGIFTPENAAIGAVAATVPPSRPVIGAYFAITELAEALAPRNDDPKDPEFEDPSDYVERVLTHSAGVAGGAALMAAPHRTAAGERRYRLNKATFAVGGGNEELSATLGDVDQTLRTEKPKVKTVADVAEVVNTTERRLNQHFETALFPIRGNKLVPTQISDALMAKANEPNLQKTPEGIRESKMYQKAAVNFQQEWSIGELDLERRRLFDARLARKGSVEQSISRRASTSTDIDQIIEDQIRDLEYDELNRRYPNQNFNNLKFRQAKLVELKRMLQKRITDLRNAQAKEQGAPILSGEKATGSISKHGLFGRVYAKVPGQGPETQANKAARKAFPSQGPVRKFLQPQKIVPGRPLPPLGQPQNVPSKPTPPPIAARVPEHVVSSVFGHDSVERFYDLKKQWSETNNSLLQYIDNPDAPEAKAAIQHMQEISQQINAMHVNEGVGTPGPIRDVVVVGAGPGGMAATTMAAADGLNVTLIDAQAEAGGQARHSSRIENYPGFPAGVSGPKLTGDMFEQATRLGAEAMMGQRVVKLEHDATGGLKTLTLANGKKIQARSVIVAGGLEFRKLNFPGSDSPNIFYGDSQALATAGKGKSVVVLGGSNGAAQAALGAVGGGAEHVYVLSRSPIVKGMSDYQVQALKASPNITVIEGDEIASLEGNQLTTKNGQKLNADAVGIYAGSAPNTDWLPHQVTRRNGKIMVNSDLMTPVPGVFAIGDIREGAIGRIGFAVGDGQVGARNVFPYLQQAFPKPVTPQQAPQVNYPKFAAEAFKKTQTPPPSARGAAASAGAAAASKREEEPEQ